MSKGSGLSYEQSYDVLRIFLRLEGFDPDKDLAPMVEKPTAAHRQGVRQALNDMPAMMANWPDHKVRALAETLQTELSIDLAQVFQANRAKVRRVLKRGAIRNDTEFYLLRSFVDQPGEPNDPDRDLVWKLLDAHEFGG